MNLIRTFIRKPVLTTMILIALLVLGINSYRDMIVEMMPQIDLPFVVVTTVYPGASPAEIESQVTKKIEDEIATIANVESIESTSMENMSQIVVEFALETDVDLDAIDVKDKVDAILSELPEDAERPIIQKWDINAIPIIELAVSAPRPLQEVYRISDRVISERLSRIGGVGEVEITGKREREIRVAIKQERLRAYGLSLLDIVGVVSAGNLNVPAGHITRGASETTIRMTGEVNDPDELAAFRIPLHGGSTIPLSEVADIRDTTEELREYSSYNGQSVIGLSIIKRSDGNTVSIGHGVNEALKELREKLDSDISIEISQDSSSFIIEAVNDVVQNIGLGILLTSILLLIFLHNWRQMIVAALSMPTSVIATFLLIEASGFTINIMTLMALGISIGTLVTNSILIIENITRFVKKGMDPFEAAEKGTTEVAVAVVAATLTNVVVFTPIAFMSGIIGRFFIQFGLTVVYATVFSLIIGFTMVPMLSARILKPKKEESAVKSQWWHELTEKWDQFYVSLSSGYRNLLESAIDHKWVPISASVLAFAFAIFLITTIGGEFMPLIDQNFFVVRMELPAGTSLDRTRELSERIEKIIQKRSEVRGTLVKIGGGQRGVEDANITVLLVEGDRRETGVKELMNIVRPQLAGIPDARIELVTEGEGGGGGESDLMIEVLSNNTEHLNGASETVLKITREIPGLVEVSSSNETGKPEIVLSPIRHQLAEHRLSARTLGMTIRTAFEGTESGVYREEGEEYDVRVQYAEEYRDDPAYLQDMPIPTPAGVNVPLADLGNLNRSLGASRILHRNKQRAVEITGNISSGSLSEIRAMIDRKLADADIPEDVVVQYGGIAEIQDESFASIFEAMILAIILIYIVMAAILESFVHPVTVMLTLPLALIGVSVGLFFWGQTINILSLMSMVMLIGIVVNNAILMLDYTSQLRNKGMGIREALLEACPVRLRPIIMANLAIAVGMIPQVTAGAGAEYRVPMAAAQIGGVLISAVFTLFVIPTVYVMIDRLRIGTGK